MKVTDAYTKLSLKMAEMRSISAYGSSMPARTDKSATDHDELCNENDCLKQRCFKMGKERMETRKVIK